MNKMEKFHLFLDEYLLENVNYYTWVLMYLWHLKEWCFGYRIK